jgi:hypothetical protein
MSATLAGRPWLAGSDELTADHGPHAAHQRDGGVGRLRDAKLLGAHRLDLELGFHELALLFEVVRE